MNSRFSLRIVAGFASLLLAVLPRNSNGQTNTNTGTSAGISITTGTYNTADGYSALQLDTTGSHNVAIGAVTLKSNIAGSYNTALGYGALTVNTASNNTALGYSALTRNTSGTDNVAVGYSALGADSTGGLNTALGMQALASTTTGASNLAAGYQALYKNITGGLNVGLGDGALYNTTGSSNIAVGEDAGFNLTVGSNNISIGNKGVAGESGIIRLGTTGAQTDTYLTGVVHGDGAGLTSVVVSAANITGTLISAQLASGAVTSTQLAANAVHSTNILAGAVGSAQLAAGAVTNTQLAANAVHGTNINAGSVGSAQLASGLTLAGTTTGTFAGDGSALTNISGAAAVGTAISSAPFTIPASGSYYLTKNLTVSAGDAITINASGVTLDLNGFSVSSTSATAAGAGIRIVSPNSNITITNGHIVSGATYNGTFSSGPGFQYGIGVSNSLATLQNVRVSGLSISGINGIAIDDLGNASVIERCVVSVAAFSGVYANLVADTMVYNSGGTAITAEIVANSRGFAVQGGTGITAHTVINSMGTSDTGQGISGATSVVGSYAAGAPANTRLLFSFVSSQNGFDTSIVIANTGLDSTGTIGINGTATIHFYGSGAPVPNTFTTPSIAVGTSYTTSLSNIAAGFQGYIEVDCNFPLAHGFGFLVFQAGTTSGTSTAVPVLVLPPVRSSALTESLSQ